MLTPAKMAYLGIGQGGGEGGKSGLGQPDPTTHKEAGIFTPNWYFPSDHETIGCVPQAREIARSWADGGVDYIAAC